MDSERRARLNARREAMRRRADREEQRGALWGVDETLAAAGTRFRLWYRDDEARPSWIGGLVPAGLFHLDWGTVGAARREVVFERERAVFACAALASRLAPDDELLVVPGNGLAPILQLSRAGFERHAELLTDLGSEMWLSGAPDWLVEFRKLDVRMVGIAVSHWPPGSG